MSDEKILISEHQSAPDSMAIAMPRQRELRGICVISPAEAAWILDTSKRHLARRERVGSMPRRRRIGKRCTRYLVHEIEGLPAESVMVRDWRTLSREELARKLGLNEKTVTRMVRDGDMPQPIHGRWLERDIDAWLLSCPLV